MTEVKTEKLTNIKPDLTNANRHTERGNAMLRASMDEFGFAEAGTLDINNRIIGGNHRTEVAADVLGSDEVLVIEVDGTKPVYIKRSDIDLATPRGKKLAYALNRVAQVSIEFDPEQVLADIGEGISLDGLFHQNEIDDLIELMTFDPNDIEFKEYDESVADEVEYIECPHCGEKIPK